MKYTPQGRKVTVRVQRREIFTEIHVRDTGKGIAPERHARIFTRFYREPEVHGQDGLGIGLYLTRKIAEMQGGYVEVRSALDGVDFTVKEREFTAIIGKSGSGKSTLLHMIGGLDTPTAGEVYVDGRKLSDMNREQLAIFRRRKVGFVFQSYNLVPDLNVYENVVLPIELDGKRIDRRFVREILELLQIDGKAEALPGMLSGGQQQRVAIARAVAAKPGIILADEPTGNLDTASGHDVMGLLKVAAKQFQQTVILITHDNDIAQMADRTVHIEDGRIVKAGDRYAGK